MRKDDGVEKVLFEQRAQVFEIALDDILVSVFDEVQVSNIKDVGKMLMEILFKKNLISTTEITDDDFLGSWSAKTRRMFVIQVSESNFYWSLIPRFPNQLKKR